MEAEVAVSALRRQLDTAPYWQMLKTRKAQKDEAKKTKSVAAKRLLSKQFNIAAARGGGGGGGVLTVRKRIRNLSKGARKKSAPPPVVSAQVVYLIIHNGIPTFARATFVRRHLLHNTCLLLVGYIRT